MSFFKSIGRAFGFGADDEEFFDDANDNSIIERNDGEPVATQTGNIVPTKNIEPPHVDPEMKARIFEGVVEIFNQTLPDFLARSVDPAAQRKVLCEALDKSVDDYLNGLMTAAEEYAEKRLQTAVDASRREAERLKNDMAQLEQQRTSLRESQLSADRRRRALSDKVTELESRLATVEAEREQFELENKGLLNKLKVADIQPGLVDDLNREIERLKAEIVAGGVAVASVELQPDAEKDGIIAELEEKVTTMQQTIETLNANIADMQHQQELSQGMYNDMQMQLAAAKEAEANAKSRLAEAEEITNTIDLIQKQLEGVEDVIQKRDERIKKLKAANVRLREENDALRRRIEENEKGLFASSLDEVEPIAEVDKDLVSEMTDLESDFECPDWFVADAGPGPVPLRSTDESFGYQEPVHKPRKPENDAQLSLF